MAGPPSVTDRGQIRVSYWDGTMKRWYFPDQEIRNPPSVKYCGMTLDNELESRHICASIIQELSTRLKLQQLVANSAIIFMHRFYMFHSFTRFSTDLMAQACLFLAAKVEEQPRRLETIILQSHILLHPEERFDHHGAHARIYAERAEMLATVENILLQTLGFDIRIDQPHIHIVRHCNSTRIERAISQVAYFLATNALHLTTFPIRFPPTFIAACSLYLASKWMNHKFPTKGHHSWFYTLDPALQEDQIVKLSDELVVLFAKYASKLRGKATLNRCPNFPLEISKSLGIFPAGDGDAMYSSDRSDDLPESANSRSERLTPQQSTPNYPVGAEDAAREAAAQNATVEDVVSSQFDPWMSAEHKRSETRIERVDGRMHSSQAVHSIPSRALDSASFPSSTSSIQAQGTNANASATKHSKMTLDQYKQRQLIQVKKDSSTPTSTPGANTPFEGQQANSSPPEEETLACRQSSNDSNSASESEAQRNADLLARKLSTRPGSLLSAISETIRNKGSGSSSGKNLDRPPSSNGIRSDESDGERSTSRDRRVYREDEKPERPAHKSNPEHERSRVRPPSTGPASASKIEYKHHTGSFPGSNVPPTPLEGASAPERSRERERRERTTSSSSSGPGSSERESSFHNSMPPGNARMQNGHDAASSSSGALAPDRSDYANTPSKYSHTRDSHPQPSRPSARQPPPFPPPPRGAEHEREHDRSRATNNDLEPAAKDYNLDHGNGIEHAGSRPAPSYSKEPMRPSTKRPYEPDSTNSASHQSIFLPTHPSSRATQDQEVGSNSNSNSKRYRHGTDGSSIEVHSPPNRTHPPPGHVHRERERETREPPHHSQSESFRERPPFKSLPASIQPPGQNGSGAKVEPHGPGEAHRHQGPPQPNAAQHQHNSHRPPESQVQPGSSPYKSGPSVDIRNTHTATKPVAPYDIPNSRITPNASFGGQTSNAYLHPRVVANDMESRRPSSPKPVAKSAPATANKPRPKVELDLEEGEIQSDEE